MRVCVYIDGFNLYHAIDDNCPNHFKWLDLKKLVSHFTEEGVHVIEKIYYFSAFADWHKNRVKRHKIYVEALKATGVTPVMGQFKEKDKSCPSCHHEWKGHEEKETDVNIALQMIDDAYQDKFDQAFLISRDSDLLPAVKLLKQRFPEKKLKIFAPPKLRHSKDLAKEIGGKNLRTIRMFHMEQSLFPETVLDSSGRVVANRPVQYSE